MNIQLIKGITTFISAMGVQTVVKNVIKTTTPANINTFNKIFTFIGEVVITGALADLSSKYVENQLGTLFKSKEEPVEEVKKENSPQIDQAKKEIEEMTDEKLNLVCSSLSYYRLNGWYEIGSFMHKLSELAEEERDRRSDLKNI